MGEVWECSLGSTRNKAPSSSPHNSRPSCSCRTADECLILVHWGEVKVCIVHVGPMAGGLNHVLPGARAVERCSLSLFQLSLSHPHTTMKPVGVVLGSCMARRAVWWSLLTSICSASGSLACMDLAKWRLITELQLLYMYMVESCTTLSACLDINRSWMCLTL